MRLRVREVGLPRLPPALAGVRIAHLSDFHLGVPSRGRRAVERAVAWVEERQPDLTCVTGDLLTRPGGETAMRALVARLPRCHVVLGNHDVGVATDPFAAPSEVTDLSPATLLRDASTTVELRGRRVQVAGVDPRSYAGRRPLPEPDPDADLRILLCHFPGAVDRVAAGAFDLVLAGHMHGGQIVLPYGAGRVHLAHPRARYTDGLYRRPGALLHVSPGLGTTFVPFRFFARPEATELVLQSG